MNNALDRELRALGQLAVSDGFKASVLAGVISIQAQRLRGLEAARRGAPRFFAITDDPEPAGFRPLPRHARPVVEGHYQYGGSDDEHEKASA